MNKNYNSAESVARDYYNSSDADKFYFYVWGGEDIHVGLYDKVNVPSISISSQKTIEKMLSYCDITESTRIIDIGSGYGGSARYIAKKYGCSVTCLNISEEQNQRNRDINQKQNLSSKITVIDGSFEVIPVEASSYDLVWAQDAILHSSNKPKVFEEVNRILNTGGNFIFTDPMQKHGVASSQIQPVLDRIHLDSMGSFELYEELGQKFCMTLETKEDLSNNLLLHYSSVLSELRSRYPELLEKSISKDYMDRMMKGLEHWINAANSSLLAWGIMKFKKI